MKVSEKQLIMLLDILKASLPIANPIGGYERHIRLQLANDLINQQSNELKEIKQTMPDENVKVPDYVFLTEI